jgi:O-acetyl-ADP-ribose deacetylase (regulator of RNase III)
MTYEHMTGDIFTTKMPALGHGVNVYGLMGAGIAKIVATKFPAVLRPYQLACRDKSLLPGGVQFVQVGQQPDRYILNLASQDKPGKYARMEWLESSLRDSVSFCKARSLKGFAIPRIGAGIGGLNWDDARELIERIGDEEPNVHIEIWSLPGA